MIQILIYSFVMGTQVLLLALALFLVYLVSKVQNLALGAMGAGIAYALYFGVSMHLPILWVILLTVGIAVFLGIVNFLLNEHLTRKREYLFALLTSFSFAIVLESLISITFGTDGKNIIPGILPVFELGSFQIPVPGFITICFGIIIAILSFFFIRLTSWGRMLRAIAESSFSAESSGINSRRVRFFVYILASFIAGAIGILAGLNTALTPMMGFQLIIMAFIAFLVGGVSDIRGTVVASYLVAFIPEFIISSLGGVSLNWKMVLVFAVAFISLSLRPKGLFTHEGRKS